MPSTVMSPIICPQTSKSLLPLTLPWRTVSEEIIVGVLTTETSSVTEAVSTLTSLCSILSTVDVIGDSVITSSSTTSKYLSNILFLKLLFLSISIYSFLSQTQYLVPDSTIII